MKKDTRTLVYAGLLMGLTTVMTMAIRIPTLATEGYLNLGDMVVFISALIMGPKYAFITGGLGSALADLLAGYNHYVPITLVVKGLEGFLAAWLFRKKLKPLTSTAIAGIFMAFGYLFFEFFMYGKAALASLPGNIAQGLVGAISSVLVYKALKRSGDLKINHEN